MPTPISLNFAADFGGNPVTSVALGVNPTDVGNVQNIINALVPYATTAAMNTAIAGLSAPNLSAYATIAGVNTLIAPLASTASVNTALTSYATTASLTAALVPYATTASLSSYLTTTTATSTYLTIATASSTYATTASLSSYATTASLGSYLTTATASSTYATPASITTALTPYATTASMNTALVPYATTASVNTLIAPLATTASLSAYLTTANASSTYLTTATASSTYLTSATASSTYLTTANATSTYLTTTNATATYLTSALAGTTYAPLASPTFTGTPNAPIGTGYTTTSTQLATMGYVATNFMRNDGAYQAAVSINIQGNINCGKAVPQALQLPYYTTGDANYSFGGGYSGIVLQPITANRVYTMPPSTGLGNSFLMANTNTSAFTWTLATPILDGRGNTITIFPNMTTMYLWSDGTNWRAFSNTSQRSRYIASMTYAATITPSYIKSDIQTLLLTGNTTINTPVGMNAGETVRMAITNGTTAYTVTWVGYKSPSATLPVLTATASALDYFEIFFDGTIYIVSKLYTNVG